LQVGVGAQMNIPSKHAGAHEGDSYGAFHAWSELVAVRVQF
jgi:hypothetical protein